MPPMQIPPGTTYGSWTVLREVDRHKSNRRFECQCTGCGSTTVKWLSNLLQGKTSCLTCRPWSDVNRAGREAIIAQRKALSLQSEEGRICLICNEWKPWSKFTNDKRRSSGKASNCIDCGNWRSMRLYFGITKAEWQSLHQDQGGLCALCNHPEGKNSRLSVDHDHSCCGPKRACKNCIRGLLCDLCNRMLGFAEQREAVRSRFADYLVRRPFQSVPAGSAGPVLEDVAEQSD